ncbi:MAG TPA: TonB-dependent receptor [Steroidobacter sp.]|uniref:TonB-dependent receptor n=1 Tax=Steroidobacter sp. TaxID=1978227 RepID=UPI002ED94790
MISIVLSRAVRSTLVGAALGVAAVPMLLTTSTVQAQERSARAAGLEEVVVTARKREESLLETPLSIQAFSSDEIASANLRNLEDVAAFSSGVSFEKLGNSQGGRYNSVIRFRGLEMLATGPLTQTGALFVDGVRVMGGAGSFAFNDVERIEIIRGPQAAFFGRGTFGGAINYVTAEPSSDFSGRVTAEYSPTFGSNAYGLMVQGPLTDSLSARLSASSQTRGAMFTATDGGKLGEETTDQVNAMLLWKPSADLKVKLNYVYGEDHDGPAATGFVSYDLDGNCPVGTEYPVQTTNGPQTGVLTLNLHCGAVPLVRVSNNTSFYTAPTSAGPIDTRSVVDHVNAFGLPATGTPHLEEFGLKSIYQLVSLSSSYDLSDSLTLSGLFGYNERAVTQIRDDDMFDALGRVTKAFLNLEGISAELRLNYDAGGRWRGMLGASYTSQESWGDFDGGIVVLTNAFGSPLLGSNGGSVDNNKIDNRGVFGSIEFDAFDWLTLTFEGRYQIDELEATTGQYPGPYSTAPKEEYKDFLPRVLATFKPYDGGTFYASYSEGVLPGQVNAAFRALTPNEKVIVEDMIPGLSTQLDAQTLDAYELGWKQNLDSINAWFSLSAYYMEWSNIPAPAQASFQSPDRNRVISLSVSVPGEAEISGFELEAQWFPVPQLNLHASVGYADATYTDFQSSRYNRTFSLPAGTNYKADDNRLPRTPKETAAASATWTADLNADWEWYVRGDVVYTGDTFTDETNMSYVPDFTTFNARFGMTRVSDSFKVELFCRNCFDKEGWRTGRRGVDYRDMAPLGNDFTHIGAIVGPIEPREYGVRMSYEF